MLLFAALGCFAQPGSNNFDKVWIQGGSVTFSTTFNGTNQPQNKIVNAPNHLYFDTGGSGICDSTGSVLLSCDGFSLYDRNLKLIDSGQYLAPSRIVNFEYGFSPYSQTSIILPFSNGIYRVITPTASDNRCRLTWEQYSDTGSIFDLLLYSEVDMNVNSGKGKVTKRMVPLLRDVRLSKTQMMACRHGDGKSWWLLKQASDTNMIYKFLFTEDKIYGPYIQGFIGEAGHLSIGDVFGQSAFSADGTKYAITNYGSHKVFIADFDRCSGMLSNPKLYNVPPQYSGNPYLPTDTDYSTCGLAFSPNGRYLYINGLTYVQQLSLYSSNPSQQWTYLSGPDTTWDEFQFYAVMYPGPDGKIYIGNHNGLCGQMSVINAPDNYGTAADFCKECLRFPPYYDSLDSQYHYYGVSTPPCMPNYRLGAANPTCYPTIISQVLTTVEFSIYPNPSKSKIEVKYSEPGILYLYDITGRTMGNYSLPSSNSNTLSVKLGSLSAGVYQYRYVARGGSSRSGKLVIAP